METFEKVNRKLFRNAGQKFTLCFPLFFIETIRLTRFYPNLQIPRLAISDSENEVGSRMLEVMIAVKYLEKTESYFKKPAVPKFSVFFLSLKND